ncbi:hypothetical protein ALI144C_07150 [Actinosynnema sp. ALI-1.44]|nr:hypothetical protein ALI144C_07150 [Actinosynnema sp. ALI-1.44]
MISHENGETEDDKRLYVVVRPDGSKGQRYEADLEDFRANNHVFTDTDNISLDNTFPNYHPPEGVATVIRPPIKHDAIWGVHGGNKRTP